MDLTGPARLPRALRARATDPLKKPASFPRLVSALATARVRFVLIGVAGANCYASSGGTIFTTQDRDLFMPPDAANELRAWRVCRSAGFELWCGGEPLGAPLDRSLAEQVVARRAQVEADAAGMQVDLTLVMAGFDFETSSQ